MPLLQYNKALAVKFDDPTATAKTAAAQKAKTDDAFDAIIVDGDAKLEQRNKMHCSHKALQHSIPSSSKNQSCPDAKDADLRQKKRMSYITAGDALGARNLMMPLRNTEKH